MVEVRTDQLGIRSLYALKDFRQGETIIGLPLTTLPEPDMYSLEAWPGIHLDCSQSEAGAINHNCDANSAVKGGAIIAWKCIKAGEQITLDYKRTEQKLAVPFNCWCGSMKCRGRIE